MHPIKTLFSFPFTQQFQQFFFFIIWKRKLKEEGKKPKKFSFSNSNSIFIKKMSLPVTQMSTYILTTTVRYMLIFTKILFNTHYSSRENGRSFRLLQWFTENIFSFLLSVIRSLKAFKFAKHKRISEMVLLL